MADGLLGTIPANSYDFHVLFWVAILLNHDLSPRDKAFQSL